MSKKVHPTLESNDGTALSARWTPDLIKEGWTPVSNFFLKNYSRLSPPIKYAEAMFLIHLLLYKWGAAAPYPSIGVIAKRMGISGASCRKLAQRLEANGYLSRTRRAGKTNEFEFEGLFSSLERLRVTDIAAAIRRKKEGDSGEMARPVHPKKYDLRSICRTKTGRLLVIPSAQHFSADVVFSRTELAAALGQSESTVFSWIRQLGRPEKKLGIQVFNKHALPNGKTGYSLSAEMRQDILEIEKEGRPALPPCPR